jgi:hypothetical protein
MPRKFRLTCARTSYFEVDLAAESAAEAERLLETALAGDPRLGERGACLGRPMHRIVEVAEAVGAEAVATEPADAAA